MNRFFSASPWMQNGGIALIRLIVGFFMAYHGYEVFDKAKMISYTQWEMFTKSDSGVFMVYLGKWAEFVAGIFLYLGLFTRIACLVIIGTMAYIAFFVGHGKVWYEDQHPFLFVLLGLVFLFTGPGSFSLDQLLFRKKAY